MGQRISFTAAWFSFCNLASFLFQVSRFSIWFQFHFLLVGTNLATTEPKWTKELSQTCWRYSKFLSWSILVLHYNNALSTQKSENQGHFSLNQTFENFVFKIEWKGKIPKKSGNFRNSFLLLSKVPEKIYSFDSVSLGTRLNSIYFAWSGQAKMLFHSQHAWNFRSCYPMKIPLNSILGGVIWI